jgi:UDP-N-acetylmuramoyl-tripeptide--D-alanyl-D-alanine ligase
MTVEQVRAACPAPVWLARPTEIQPASVNLTGLTIDSRAVEPGQVFLALKGDRFDGHDFLPQAADAGAALLIVDRELPPAMLAQLSTAAESSGRKGGLWVLRVQDTRKALGRIAAAWRAVLGAGGAKVIAVCGSNGKTTTVRLIDAVLGASLCGVASEKSFNNDIGVPLTLLRARPGHQYVICEVGTNHPGEIAALGAVCTPDIAVITSIGREHLEFLGDLTGVAREEAAILTALRPGGVGIVTADAPPLREFLKPAPAIITFGQAPDADLRLTDFAHTLIADQPAIRLSHNGQSQAFLVPLVGRHNASNALAAIAVGRRLGLADKVIAEGLLCCRPPEMRWQAHDLGAGLRVVNDAYNANPDSVLAALATFAELFPAGRAAATAGIAVPPPVLRRVAVLADMFELGPAASPTSR